MKTSRVRWLLAWALGVVLLAGGRSSAAADEAVLAGEPSVAAESDSSSVSGPFQIDWEVTFATWYSFQGLDYSDRKPVFQPALTGSLMGISIGAWGNLDHSRGELNEVDLTLQWSLEGRRASGGLGYAYLQYPHRTDWEPSQEILGEITLEAPLAPSASVHWDVDKGRGRYWTLGLEGEIPGPATPITLSGSFYYQDRYYGMTGIPAVETRAGIQLVWRGVAWKPSLARLWSWENGDFRGTDAVEPGWLFTVSISPP